MPKVENVEELDIWDSERAGTPSSLRRPRVAVETALRQKRRVSLAVGRRRQENKCQQRRRRCEVKGLGVVKLPLLPREVTGPRNLLDFSQLLVSPGFRQGDPKKLVDRKEERQTLCRCRDRQNHWILLGLSGKIIDF